VKVLIKHLAIFFLFPSKKYLPISFNIQLLETSSQKQKEQRQKQLDVLDVSFFHVFSLPVHFDFFAIFSYCLHFAKFVCLLKRLPEIETGIAEKSSWDQANIRQKLGLVWRNRKKINQIIIDYFYLPFLLLIILWYLLCMRYSRVRRFLFQNRGLGDRHALAPLYSSMESRESTCVMRYSRVRSYKRFLFQNRGLKARHHR
jgi:hypothetical protein